MARIAGIHTGLTKLTTLPTTSGTSVDFTSIPSWAKRITISLNGVSSNGTAHNIIQLGTSGGLQTTGYLSYFGAYTNTSAVNSTGVTAGFGFWSGGASDTKYGTLILTNMGGNLWSCSYSGSFYNGSLNYVSGSGGAVTLSGTLDRIRLTSTNGTDTFDAGSVSVMYE